MSNSTDFKATISITNQSPLTKQMVNLLPSNYTRSQSSNIFSLLYGSGYEMEQLKKSIGQSEANNYIYSPSTQNGAIEVNGAGRYLIEFDIPFVVPPLNVNINSASYSDAFVEFTSRFGITINVRGNSRDIISWNARGFVGAAYDEVLGDALYNNFGSLVNLPRSGDSIVNDAFVRRYEAINTLIKVEQMTTVIDFSRFPQAVDYNIPPLNAMRGYLRATNVFTTPGASHELLDTNGNLLALITFAANSFPIGVPVAQRSFAGQTFTQSASAFLPENITAAYGVDASGNAVAIPTYEVYVSGVVGTYQFSRWDQPAFQQEIFRADNQYRRLLSGINRSLRVGPNALGVSNMIETILGQPYIPQETWETSDFRIFKNAPPSPNNVNPTPPFLQYNPAYLTDTNGMTVPGVDSASQFGGYPANLPHVVIEQVQTDWTPESLTYNTRPVTQPLTDVLPVQVQDLNKATRFDITNEVIRQLRIGLDLREGGIIDWNWLSPTTTVPADSDSENSTTDPNTDIENALDATDYDSYLDIYTKGWIFTGQSAPYDYLNNTTRPYNFFFLNNPSDTFAGMTLFYYEYTVDSTGASSFVSHGPLTYNRDYYIIETASLYNPFTNGYDLPSELLNGYAANSNYPALATFGGLTAGQRYTYNPALNNTALPSFVIQLDLSSNTTSNTRGRKFPPSANGFLLYSYAAVNCAAGVMNGTFDMDPQTSTYPLVEYCDAKLANSVQPSDSPFTDAHLRPAQGSFARMTSSSGHNAVVTMVGGQVTFTRTVTVDSLMRYKAANPVQTVTQVNPAPNSPVGTPNTTPPSLVEGPPGIIVLQVTGADTVTAAPAQAYSESTKSQYYVQNDSYFTIWGYITKNIQPSGQPWFQLDNATYLLMNNDGRPVAILTESSTINAAAFAQSGQYAYFSGRSSAIVWDTRMPVTNYFTDAPIYQVSNNFDVEVLPFTPTLEAPVLPINTNFLAVVQAVPVGNQQQLEASWTFQVREATPAELNNVPASPPTLAFPDIGSKPGILTWFTGTYFQRFYGSDPDAAVYDQQYVSPTFQAYFLNYKDLLNTSYGNGVHGGKLSTVGDASIFDTVYNTQTTPASKATILNFFSPLFGFFALSVIPGMEFYRSDNNNAVDIVRPLNKGICLRLERDSASGLVFYGRNDDKIVDKPTRLLIEYTYQATGQANRHRVIEIETTDAASWVDGLHPNTVQTSSTFFLAGNQFKYAHSGYDQAGRAYLSNVAPQDPTQALVSPSSLYTLTSLDNVTPTPPVYEADISQVVNGHTAASTPSTVTSGSPKGQPGYPQRYRRPPVIAYNPDGTETTDPSKTGYFNLSPEKMAFFTFDFSLLPVDTYLKEAVLEIFFCSGFTITEGKDKNLSLSYNRMWSKSRLSGNGRTHLQAIRDAQNNVTHVVRPINNVHWRKNYFEVLVPYAFAGETTNSYYGIEPLFNQPTQKDVFPQSLLQYLGFVNLNEIAISPLASDNTQYSEDTEGLSNIVITDESVIYVVHGSLELDSNGNPDVSPYNPNTGHGVPIKFDKLIELNGVLYPPINQLDAAHFNLPPYHRYLEPIEQRNVLPNMKVIVYPFGAGLTSGDPNQPSAGTIPQPNYGSNFATTPWVYGYVKSFLPYTEISFDAQNVALYNQLLNYICPLYSQYNVKLLQADTYFPYLTFGRNTDIADTVQDISY